MNNSMIAGLYKEIESIEESLKERSATEGIYCFLAQKYITLARALENRQTISEQDRIEINRCYKKAFQLSLTDVAEYDNLESLYGLAKLYENGNGVEKNPTVALACYTKAAELGHEEAQRYLEYLSASSPRNLRR